MPDSGTFSNSASDHQPPERDQVRRLDAIFDEYCEQLDLSALKQVEAFNDFARELRSVNPECADEVERLLTKLQSDGRFGTNLCTYIKTDMIRPIQTKYRKPTK